MPENAKSQRETKVLFRGQISRFSQEVETP